MTNRAGRQHRDKQPGRWTGSFSPAWLLVLGVWLGSLLNLALNTATDPTKPYPWPVRWLQLYPWQTVVLLTLLTAVLARWQWGATQPVDSRLPSGVLTLRQEREATGAELTGLRRPLLEQVRRTWIQGVLDRSLAQVARVELGLAEQPGAIHHPWGALQVQPGQPDQALPPGTGIAAVANRLDGQLLILGAPGAGKTTLLLEYTRDLLEQADRDGSAPIPVVFHLSAWPAEQPPLADWLAEELGLRYGVSRRLGVELVQLDRLALLLDGLDEVPQARRTACVAAINTFRSEHGGVPLVVCARTRDYQELTDRLLLNGAVAVQPLDRGQITRWLVAAGPSLAGLRTVLGDPDHWLWGLLDSPLLLSIAALTYRGQPASAVRAHGSTDNLLEAYVQAAMARPRAPLAQQDQVNYADADTLRWLGWLAERMGEQSVFYPDWMQPDWLPTRLQRWLAITGLGLAGGLAVGLAVGLVGALTLGPQGAVAGAIGGAAFGGMGMGLTRNSARIEPVEPTRWSWNKARRNLAPTLDKVMLGVWGLPLNGAVVGGCAGVLLGGLTGALVGALVGALFVVLPALLGSGFQSPPNLRPTAPLQGIHAAAKNGRSSGLTTWLAIGLLVGLFIGLFIGARGLAIGLAFGTAFGLADGLSSGGASYLRHRLLTLLLRRRGVLPADLIGFLDYADSRILLRRAGGGYTFIHRLLQDYLGTRVQRRAATLTCSFCGKDHRQVNSLIAGPGVYICNECVDLCVELIAQERPKA